jgi:pimeloyl-ACP methyl ester carboxylesterase
MSFERKTVKLSGGELPYWVGGHGQPVLYLHAAGGARMTEGLNLLARERRIYMPVIPGFDDTPLFEDVSTMQDIAHLGANFIENVIGERTDVIGQSFGGWAAAWLGADHADALGLLVLECPAGFRPEGHPPPSSDPDLRLRQMCAYPDRRPPETKSEDTLSRNRDMLNHYHGATVRDEALIARLGEIEALTLILIGTKDGRIPPASVRLLKDRMARAYLVYVYDAAHSIETDQPERFATVVGDFLERGETFIVNQVAAPRELTETGTG